MIGYATKYFEGKIAFDVSKAELDFLRQPKTPNAIGLDARVNRYIDDKAANRWQDPRCIEDLDDMLKRPLRFYGGHCSLSMSDKIEISEDQISTYYKCLIKDLEESSEHTQSQVKFLIGENKSLRNEIVRLEAVEQTLLQEIADWGIKHTQVV